MVRARSNEVVHRLVARADAATNAKLTTLAEGGVVTEPLDLSVVYGEIGSYTGTIWPELYLAGYLTTHDVAEPNDSEVVRTLEVPNREVNRLFRRELVARAQSSADGRDALASLHTALRSGDARALEHELERALLDSVSYYNLRSEHSCHMWLLSLLYGMRGYRFPRSNREVGRGRPDIIVEPEAARAHALPAIVTEVKFRADASHDELAVVAHATLADQAMRKRYAHGLVGHGAIPLVGGFRRPQARSGGAGIAIPNALGQSPRVANGTHSPRAITGGPTAGAEIGNVRGCCLP